MTRYDDFSPGLQRIAKADIDCQIDLGAADRGDSAQPETAIVELFANAIDTPRVQIKNDAVFAILREDVPECHQHRVFAWVAKTQQIEIARPAVRIVEPAHHQHGALKHEVLGMRRLAEPEQKALQREAREHEIETLPVHLGELEKPGAHGGTDILDLLSH
jgi:hypothetical protein